MSVSEFGRAEAGEAVRAVSIAGGGLSAELIEWGASMRDLRIDGLDRPLVLGLAGMAEYETHGAHVGAVAGRMANRISGGRFEIDGVAYRADRNVDGKTTLHGGAGGFGRCVWRLVDHGAGHARFAIRHEDGEQGFPGAIEAECLYCLEDGAVAIELTARAEAPTLCNLAQHNYYNLSGAARIDDHELRLTADRLTPLGPDSCPTGEIATVAPEQDFREFRVLADARIDVNYVLAGARRAAPAPAAWLRAGGVEMAVETTEPGLQVYTGHWMAGPLAGTERRVFASRSGVCLETQLWPDAPNHAGFPSALLRPNETYRQITRLRLSRT